MIYEVNRTEVKSTHIFQIDKFYEQFRWYLIQNGWADRKDIKFPEVFYYESRTQTKGREFYILWRPEKDVGNGFFKRRIEIDLHGVGITDVEIMYANKKVKAHKGKMEVLFRAKIILDADGSWNKSKFLAPMFEWYYKRVWNKELESQKKELLIELNRMTDFTKRFFNLPPLGPEGQPFQPTKGYMEDNF